MRDPDGADEGIAQLSPPSRLFERLAQLSGYTWDQSIRPFHSTYDNWHVFGLRHSIKDTSGGASSLHGVARTDSTSSSPKLKPRSSFKHHPPSSNGTSEDKVSKFEGEDTYKPIIARVSTHALRIEREYHLCKSFQHTSDPNCNHIARLVDLIRLPSRSAADETLIVSIFESPGRNYMRHIIDFGSAWLDPAVYPTAQEEIQQSTRNVRNQISLSTFLDFAIGASECLELLHHGIRVVHGELRADAFHFNQETGAVKIINFGSGPRSFENGLTSSGWTALSREPGVKQKLQYIAPEQTGRMPAEPDSRTDIYSLGVLFWTLLTGKPAFEGKTPLDVVQAVLGRRLPPVSSERINVPDIISQIIQKMTQKQIYDRYHSTSGLKHDLVEVRHMLGEGDTEALAKFNIGSKDVSSFFMLPTNVFGREEEHDRVIHVIKKVSKRQREAGGATTSGLYSLGPNPTSTMSDRLGNLEIGTRSSDTSSQLGKDSAGSPVLAPSHSSMPIVRSPQLSLPQADCPPSASKPLLEVADSKDSIETTFTFESQTSGIRPDQASGHHYSPGQIPRGRDDHKSRRRQRCEVVSIIGAAGLGKSSLIQSTQSEIRRSGYLASAKFDPAKKAPFEPMLHAMGSLFRQIFSESDVNTDYHNTVRRNIRPFWASICAMLDLPEGLIATEAQGAGKIPVGVLSQGLNRSLQADITDSSSIQSTHSGIGTLGSASHKTSGFLGGGANPRSLEFVTIYVEVLRILSTSKLICLCLDDLHYAEDESLDLIASIIGKKLGIVILTTCRDVETSPKAVNNVLKNDRANLTVIELSNLDEQEVMDYVAATLSRPIDYVLPLAVVCLEKSSGNPFYLRQMLELCHRKGCIWYSWKESVWEYDLDRVFAEFESDSYGQQLNTSFITRRLQDLPPAARSILAWASILGTSFSFALIQRLLTGEFDYSEDGGEQPKGECVKVADLFSPQPVENVVAGLQATLQAYILMPGSSEDEFCFSHDRYVQASASLRECQDVEKMQFLIVQAMMKYSDLDGRGLYARARHVCQAADVIKRRTQYRGKYRKLLIEAAQRATESGARPTALQYYETCLCLMQENPWKTGAPDVSYEETFNVYTKAAELYWHQGQFVEAQNLLDNIFANAKRPSEKAPAWILQSRLFSQSGNMAGAFTALKTSLLELGLGFAPGTTWELCDRDFRKIRERIQRPGSSLELTEKPLNIEPNFTVMGAVLIEAVSAAFWSDALLFYQLVMKMMECHLNNPGMFPQIGLGYAYFAMISIVRCADPLFALEMHDASLHLLEKYEDSYTTGRGLAVSALFIAHLLSPIRSHSDTLEAAIDHSLVSGDKHLYLLSVAGIAITRLLNGDDMAELESYCSYVPEDFLNWAYDLRGGTILIACRQVVRSLQGKTWSESPETVISDDSHMTADYMSFIASRASNADRPRVIYSSLMLIPLYLYGHYDKAVEVSNVIIPLMSQWWSIRNTRLILFYGSLSVIAKVREIPLSDLRADLLATVREYKAQIVEWQSQCNANYRMWSLIIEAELCDVDSNYHNAIQAYEEAIDHSQLYDFNLDLALAFELQGEFFIRRGAKRAARSTLMDAITIYSRIGACGKSEQLAAKHEWVLSSSSTVRTRDVGVQTAHTIGDIGNTQLRIEENERQETKHLGRETAGDRTNAWVSPTPMPEIAGTKASQSNMSGLGLDVLDLQSILEFNQAISSELQIDRLLAKMTEIILESAGAQADLAAVVIESENGWCIAASGTADGITADARPITDIHDETQKQVLLYTMRFKEVLFVHNLAHDERFLHKASAKSVLSLPILQGKDLLGVLYLEGQPNSFTDRNHSVLQLFCNQMSISIANALLFRKIAKVSASNTSMIESQKRALIKARDAELKAKAAEAEAMENVRLKEEAARAKSMFLANVSHELRTPLNGVIGMSELLKATSLNKEQDGYADSIRVCADTLLTVINDILDFSKLEAGKMKLFSVPLNLKETITEVVRALAYSNLERGLQTLEELDLDPKLLVMGDPVRLHQIIMNLLSNSYKFTAKGSVIVRARTDFEDKHSIQVTCSITDTGIGITQEQASRLFQPFVQADASTQRSYGGSGLGLSICKALVDVLNGKISLESQMGVGTTVTFTLQFPKATKATTPGNGTVSTNSEPDLMATWSSDTDNRDPQFSTASFANLSQIPRDQLRICIAEDNPINQKIAVSFVTKLGFKPEAYNDGLQAVEALRRRSKDKDPFHLVLMDVQMPVLDGYDATRLIRKDEDPAVRNVLIIAMTASAIRGDREKCLQAGMNNYLAKPVRAAVLKSMLEEYLSQPPEGMSGLQETTNDLAKGITKGAQQQQQEKKNAATASSKARKPSFSKRMSGRNDIPLSPDDPESAAATPRAPVAQFVRSAASSDGSANSGRDGEAMDVAEDHAVPPLSLTDGAAEKKA